MANVFFKRGLHASLPTSGTSAVIDGTFYLTTDTNRLYVGQGQNLVELNKSITSVAAVSNLPTTGVATGQFYYATAENVLCYYTGSGWTQINPDTRLEDTNQNTSITSASNAATITSDVAEDLGAQAHHSIGSFTIKGDSNLDVSVSGNEITLAPNIANITSATNTTYTVSTADHSGGGADIRLVSSDTTPIIDTVGIVGTNAATVTQANDVITVDVANPIATTEAGFNANGVLTIDTSVNGNNSNPDSVTPIIMLGGTANDNLDANGYKFVGSNEGAVGTVTLPVYTKKQTEERISAALTAADAMTYRGTVGNGSNQTEANADATTKLVSTANAGDTYKVYQAITTPVAASAGDLVIAEGSDGAVTWVVVPSGDDQAVAGEVGALSFEISDGSGELAGATFAAGTHMAVTGTANGTTDTHTTITIAQAADYTAQTAAGSNAAVTQAAGGQNASTATFTAVTAIQTDAYGNVVNGSIQTQTLTVTDTHNKVTEIEADATVANNVGTISISASDDDQNDITAGEFTISSTGNSITLTETATGINAEIVWGTF